MFESGTISLFTFLVMNVAAVYCLKLSASLFFLIFIRAGLPRYRYDFLTKLGWVKFLLVSIASLIAVFCSYALWF